MPLPNFLIIGAAKSGTTSLYNYLHQHPDVYVSPNKEPRFFAFEGETFEPEHRVHSSTVTTLKEYKTLFEGVTHEKAIGEASPSYLANAKSIERIKHYVPDARLVAILRNPVERAYSHFLHAVLHDLEPKEATFEQALRNEVIEFDGYVRHRPYIDMGFYGRQLEPYIESFPSAQLHVFLFDELRADPTSVAQELYRFLGVDEHFTPDVGARHAKTGVPRHRLLHRMLTFTKTLTPALRSVVPSRGQRVLGRLRAEWMNANLTKPSMPADAKAFLQETYRDDVLKLQALLRRDLSHWIEP